MRIKNATADLMRWLFLFVKIKINSCFCTQYRVKGCKKVKPLERKKIKKWLPLVIAIIQLATAVITAINKE